MDAEGLQADRRSVEVAIQNIDEEMDLIIAVGTGTIHDICRCIAHEYGVPFVSVPTAASYGWVRQFRGDCALGWL